MPYSFADSGRFEPITSENTVVTWPSSRNISTGKFNLEFDSFFAVTNFLSVKRPDDNGGLSLDVNFCGTGCTPILSIENVHSFIWNSGLFNLIKKFLLTKRLLKVDLLKPDRNLNLITRLRWYFLANKLEVIYKPKEPTAPKMIFMSKTLTNVVIGVKNHKFVLFSKITPRLWKIQKRFLLS